MAGGAADPPLASAGVLVAAGEFVLAFELVLLLRGFGCLVIGPVSSIVEAVELLGRERPDAALLDLDLLDGLAVPVAELLSTMRVPFALVTARGPERLEHPALKQAPHLGKPIGHGALRRMLVSLLSTPRVVARVPTRP